MVSVEEAGVVEGIEIETDMAIDETETETVIGTGIVIATGIGTGTGGIVTATATVTGTAIEISGDTMILRVREVTMVIMEETPVAGATRLLTSADYDIYRAGRDNYTVSHALHHYTKYLSPT